MQEGSNISALYLQVPMLDGVDEFYRSALGMQNHLAKADFDTDQYSCLLYTSPSPRDATLSRMPSSA